MRRNTRLLTRPHASHVTSHSVVLFDNAEQAWLWFARCQALRRDGVRPQPGLLGQARPCDPDDLYHSAMTLHRRRDLNTDHLRVLSRFALIERSPDVRCHEEQRAARIWREALDRLSSVWRSKGFLVQNAQ